MYEHPVARRRRRGGRRRRDRAGGRAGAGAQARGRDRVALESRKRPWRSSGATTTKRRVGAERSGKTGLVPLLPLRDIVVFPHMVVPLFVGRPKSIRALEARDGRRSHARCSPRRRDADDGRPEPEDIYRVGTLGSIIQLAAAARRHRQGAGRGQERARVRESGAAGDRTSRRRDRRLREEATTLARDARRSCARSTPTFETYVEAEQEGPAGDASTPSRAITDPAQLADTVVAHLNLKLEDRQRCSRSSARGRAPRGGLRPHAGARSRCSRSSARSARRVKKQMERSQKEYYLNEQMRAIQKELGERDEFKNEIQELEEQLAARRCCRRTRDRTEKEIKKLKLMSPMSRRSDGRAELHRLDARRCPGTSTSDEKNDVNEAEEILDGDHYGLEKPKERILEYLAVQTLVEQAEGSDPLPRRPAGRRQDVARQVDRARDRTATSCASRSAACATRPRSAATAAPTSARCRARSSRA